MSCNDICKRYKITGNPRLRRYENGQKRCHKCEIYIRWDGLFCPCCGYRLRINARGPHGKENLRRIE